MIGEHQENACGGRNWIMRGMSNLELKRKRKRKRLAAKTTSVIGLGHDDGRKVG
jgi:hypothetical protein